MVEDPKEEEFVCHLITSLQGLQGKTEAVLLGF